MQAAIGGSHDENLTQQTPSPAMVVAIVALIAALAGTAYAAQTINGGAIKKQTIGGGKLKQKTLTGYQINTEQARRGALRASAPPTPTGRSSTTRPGPATRPWRGPATPASPRPRAAARSRSSSRQNVTVCANVADRNNAGTTVPAPGFAQTNSAAGNPNAIEVRTRDEKGVNEDADFHLIVVCP